ncbi:MAG: tetratricopeptide repeat protein [Luteitalea sp.]|nr:tetratricopeptide repeat protein [Luteitalea sp.]
MEPLVKYAIVAAVAVALMAGAAASAYQAAARERDYRLLLTRGDVAVAQDQAFSAIENYSGAVALRPDSMLAHLRRGQTYRQRGSLNAAARDFRTASVLDPSATRPLEELGDVFYKQKFFKRSAEVYETRLRLDERAPHITFRLALARYRNGDRAAALAAIGQTLRLDNTRSEPHYLMGLCLREEGDLAGASAAFEKAVERSPGLIAAHEELADLYAQTGRPNEELEQLQLIAALDRNQVARQVEVGLAHARASRLARDPSRQERQANLAILTLGSVLERSPDQPGANRALGDVWLGLAQSRQDPLDLRKALEALQYAAAAPGAPSDALALYGRALLLDGQVDAAEQVLQQAISRFPVEPAAFLDYALAAERRNHVDAARTALIQYSALVPGDRDSADRALRIGLLSLRADDAPTAVVWLTRAGSRLPDDTRVYAALADAQLRLGNTSAARAAVDRGLELSPGHAHLAALASKLR